MVEAGGVEIFRVLKTLNLLKTRDAQNSETQKLRLTLTGTYLERDERIRFLERGPSRVGFQKEGTRAFRNLSPRSFSSHLDALSVP